jgi:hypothetical protein
MTKYDPERPTPFVESNALLALTGADPDQPGYTDLARKILSGSTRGELIKLARVADELSALCQDMAPDAPSTTDEAVTT